MDILRRYLTDKQIRHIQRYWKQIEIDPHEHFNGDYWVGQNPDEYRRCGIYMKYNKTKFISIEDERQRYDSYIEYLQKEYKEYLNKLGYELENRSYNEILYNFLNEGFIMDTDYILDEDK